MLGARAICRETTYRSHPLFNISTQHGEPDRGYEIMNAIRKGQIENIAKDDILGQKNFVHSLFGIAV